MSKRDINIVNVPTTEDSLHDCSLFLFDFYCKRGYKCYMSKGIIPGMRNIVNGCLILQSIPNYPPDTIILNMEHLYDESIWLNPPYVYKNLLIRYEVFDFNVSNVEYLNKLGNDNVKLIKMGYTRMLKNINSKVSKDINVLFYGGINERRGRFINLIKKEIPNVAIYENDLWGLDKTKTISRAKIVINIHYYDPCNLEIIRIFHLLINGKFVISESSNDDGEYKDITDGFIRTIIGNPEDMVEKIKYYLNHNDELNIMAKKGRRLIKARESEYPLTI